MWCTPDGMRPHTSAQKFLLFPSPLCFPPGSLLSENRIRPDSAYSDYRRKIPPVIPDNFQKHSYPDWSDSPAAQYGEYLCSLQMPFRRCTANSYWTDQLSLHLPVIYSHRMCDPRSQSNYGEWRSPPGQNNPGMRGCPVWSASPAVPP